MNIYVVGAGSVGLLVASFLANKAHHVTIVTRREEQRKLLQENGLMRKNLDGTEEKLNVSVSTNLENVPNESMIFVTVKYGQLQTIYPMIASVQRNIPIVFLQNGLAHYEEALRLEQNHILFASCQFGAERENDYTVIHRGAGVMKVALGRGDSQYVQVIHSFSSDHFPIETVDDAEQMLFEKALLNCFINPMTALLHMKNGQLIENPYTKDLLQRLYEELMEAFPEQRHQFPFEWIVNLCEKTAKNTSSMLSDRLKKQPTEAETIVGAIIKKAERKGKDVPTLKTLYLLLLALENRGE